jgi:hypothetical protein
MTKHQTYHLALHQATHGQKRSSLLSTDCRARRRKADVAEWTHPAADVSGSARVFSPSGHGDAMPCVCHLEIS